MQFLWAFILLFSCKASEQESPKHVQTHSHDQKVQTPGQEQGSTIYAVDHVESFALIEQETTQNVRDMQGFITFQIAEDAKTPEEFYRDPLTGEIGFVVTSIQENALALNRNQGGQNSKVNSASKSHTQIPTSTRAVPQNGTAGTGRSEVSSVSTTDLRQQQDLIRNTGPEASVQSRLANIEAEGRRLINEINDKIDNAVSRGDINAIRSLRAEQAAIEKSILASRFAIEGTPNLASAHGVQRVQAPENSQESSFWDELSSGFATYIALPAAFGALIFILPRVLSDDDTDERELTLSLVEENNAPKNYTVKGYRIAPAVDGAPAAVDTRVEYTLQIEGIVQQQPTPIDCDKHCFLLLP